MTDSPLIAKLIEENEALERAGDYATALRHGQTVLAQARADNDSPAIAAMLVRVSAIQFRLGHYNHAQAAANEALQYAAPDASTRAQALMMLGNIASETYSLATAEDLYHRAADLAREIGCWPVRQRTLHDLATNIYMPRGQFTIALAADQEAVQIGREHNEIGYLVPASTTIAENYVLTRQHRLAHNALDELDQVAHYWQLARGFSFWLKAELAIDEDFPDQAPVLLKQAFAIAEELGDPALSTNVRLGMSRYYRTIGNRANAHTWASDAVTYAERLGYRHIHGMALIERGRTSWGIGEVHAAETDLKASIEILTPLQAHFDFTRAWLILAALYGDQRSPQAIESWKNAARGIVAGGYGFLLQRERALAFPLIASYLGHSDAESAVLAVALIEHLERVPAPALQITTLGRFQVRQGSRTISDRDWRKRLAGELFRLLLTSPGQSLTSEEIIEALWADKTPQSANEFLHQATSTLRRVLEPELPAKFPSRYLDCEGEQICLRLPPHSWVDYQEFERAVELHEWGTAHTLYHGDLFPGDRYADWATDLRERLCQRHIQVQLALAEEHLAAGWVQEALACCRRILEQEPWHETAVLLGMRAALAEDNRAVAVQLYKDLELTLKEELDISPQPPLREFYESLLR